MNEELELVTTEEIENLIYTIRGKQVMIDSDVANLYHYETKRINEVVNRNKQRFPERFCFQLTENEIKSLRSQFATLNKNGRGQHRKYLPYVFTEQGISMLAPLLKNEIAVQVSINIMDAFVRMRHFLCENGQVFERLTTLEFQQIENNKKFNLVFDKLQEKQIENQRIFFDGQIFDAYSLIIEIIKKAKHKITIIDNYVDDSILEMLSKKKNNVEVVILTSNKSNIKNIDIQKFNKQYPTLKVAKTDKFHDRFIVLDEKDHTTLVATSTENKADSGFLGNTEIPRNKIRSVTIKNSFGTHGADEKSWNVSASQNRTYLAWSKASIRRKYI